MGDLSDKTDDELMELAAIGNNVAYMEVCERHCRRIQELETQIADAVGTSHQLNDTQKFLLADYTVSTRIERLQEWLEDPERTHMQMAGALVSAMTLINVMDKPSELKMQWLALLHAVGGFMRAVREQPVEDLSERMHKAEQEGLTAINMCVPGPPDPPRLRRGMVG